MKNYDANSNIIKQKYHNKVIRLRRILIAWREMSKSKKKNYLTTKLIVGYRRRDQSFNNNNWHRELRFKRLCTYYGVNMFGGWRSYCLKPRRRVERRLRLIVYGRHSLHARANETVTKQSVKTIYCGRISYFVALLLLIPSRRNVY